MNRPKPEAAANLRRVAEAWAEEAAHAALDQQARDRLLLARAQVRYMVCSDACRTVKQAALDEAEAEYEAVHEAYQRAVDRRRAAE